MGIGLMNRIWWREDLDSSEKLVLLALADRAGDEDGVCWYAVDTIARKSSLHRRSVQRILTRLIEHGLLRKVHRHDRSNYYMIPVDKFPYPELQTRPAKERGPEEFMAEIEPDLFGMRGDGESPRRGDSRSVRGDSRSVRGDGESPDSSMIPEDTKDPIAQSADGETVNNMIIRRWNEIAAQHDKLTPVRFLSDARKEAIARRTMEWLVVDLGDGPLGHERVWKHAFQTIASSKLLTGQKTSWAATLDWILKKSNFAKIMEGNYGHGHDKIDGDARDPNGRSAVAAVREARRIANGARERSAGEARRAGGRG